MRTKMMFLFVRLFGLMGLFFIGFVTGFTIQPTFDATRTTTSTKTCLYSSTPSSSPASQSSSSSPSSSENKLERVDLQDEGVPIAFVDHDRKSFIECFADSVANLNGQKYTIGVPCDYAVALCYLNEKGNLVPIELNDSLMDDVFGMAESIVADEFGEELTLQRTPQTLTLVGELEEDAEEEEDDDDDDDDDDEGGLFGSGEEEVEELLSFEFRDREFTLVRLLDPILLVGKNDEERSDIRVLLTPEESVEVMPLLEDMFLQYHVEKDERAP